MTYRICLGLVICALSINAFSETAAPYAGEEAREIKSLSHQEVSGYLEGRGMGYAKVAELNHYPGPRHVLDLAADLGLGKEQIERTEAIFADMKSQAVSLGKRIVDKEAELERRFASGSVDSKALKKLLSEIGSLQSELRYVHLNAHLQQRALLTSDQIVRYDRLRGYGKSHNGKHDHAH